MQGAIARVLVVVAALLNQPLLFPPGNTTVEDQDEELIARMREREESLAMEKTKLENEFSVSYTDEAYCWYFWYTVSFIVLLTIEMCKVDLPDKEMQANEEEDILSESGSVTPSIVVLGEDVLNSFCDKCNSQFSSHKNCKVMEFVDWFAEDLLRYLRKRCSRETKIKLGDFVWIGSIYEFWEVCGALMCDLIVPFTPPDPYTFHFHLWHSASCDIHPDMQGCGSIKLTRPWEREICICDLTNLGEDVLCLLHNTKNGNGALKVSHTLEKLLCSKNTLFLAKDKVMKWFQVLATKAWGRISPKYKFEVTFRNSDAAGALKIGFSSGRVLFLNIIPVVQLEGTEAYFVSNLPSDCNISPDPYWPLSFAVYEKNLLEHLENCLPKNSCHLHCFQIVTFLHRKQRGLTGKSALTNYHIKTALLHLLLSKRPSAWDIKSMENRLRDVLSFLQKSLQEKRLNHIIVGNSKIPEELQVPLIFRKAEPINLFRSLVLQRTLHALTVRHFQEMLRNATMLLKEYTPLFSSRGLHFCFCCQNESL